jgi:mannose/fructose-specific phosphotransferase system component IIA
VAQVCCCDRFLEPETLGLVVRAVVSAEENIHERTKVGIVAGVAVPVVVPVVQLRSAEEHAEWADRKADIGVKVGGPQTAEEEETRP